MPDDPPCRQHRCSCLSTTQTHTSVELQQPAVHIQRRSKQSLGHEMPSPACYDNDVQGITGTYGRAWYSAGTPQSAGLGHSGCAVCRIRTTPGVRLHLTGSIDVYLLQPLHETLGFQDKGKDCIISDRKLMQSRCSAAPARACQSNAVRLEAIKRREPPTQTRQEHPSMPGCRRALRTAQHGRTCKAATVLNRHVYKYVLMSTCCSEVFPSAGL